MFKKMLDSFFKQERETYQKHIKDLKDTISSMEDEIVELEQQVSPFTDEDSSVIFSISNDLKITPKTKVNKDIIPALVDSEFIKSNESDNTDILQLALILIANEATEQILLGVNDNEN